MTFQECLNYTLHENKGAVVSVGILQNGHIIKTVYGENAQIVPDDERLFEIGSLTKTITAALIQQTIDEGFLKRTDTVGSVLALPNLKYNPTLEQLLTHRSGYKGTYFAPPMTKNFFLGRNSFYGVSRDSVLAQLQSIQLADKEYPFAYSNFGYAVLGLALEQVYPTDYASLANSFVQNELGMPNTHISSGKDELQNGWDWSNTDAYRSAGALVSTMDDMLIYAGHLLNQSPAVLQEVCEPIVRIDATSNRYASYGLRMDSIGSAWIFDDLNGIVWHNGGTGHYSCYLGFDPQRQIAVIVLTNLAPNERIPATVLGAKLLLELQATRID
jgi:CubicO group peptidase (beta-lactamase class C family)